MRWTARVPATSANLGPGFDSFGLALDLCNEVTVDTEGEPGVTWEGEGADELPTDGTDMVSRAIAVAAKQQARLHSEAALPPFRLHGVNRIPLERGLGSSSAAAVAGVALADVLLGPAGWRAHAHTTFAYAAELEGHPDNAAAAAYGGFTVVADGYVHRLEPHPALRPVVLIPDLRLSTDEARKALAADVPRSDAVYNLAHAALAAIAVTADPDLLLVALHDRLHEDVRLAMVPPIREVAEELRRSQIPTCLSGAGPTLLAFEREGQLVLDPGDGWRVLRPGVRSTGVEILDD